MTKRKLKTKARNEMELNRHNIWKPWEEKSHWLWSKTHSLKPRLKAPQRVAEKTSQVPHMIHLSLIWILWSSTVIISENYHNKVKWRQLNNTKYNLISGWEMYFIGSKCIMKYWWPEWNYRIHEINVDQSIIRCNYIDKFPYWNLKTNA
jgi:hypothetical protein